MKIFKPNTQIQQDQVFDRLSDSFAALFFSINPDIRDKVFKVGEQQSHSCNLFAVGLLVFE